MLVVEFVPLFFFSLRSYYFHFFQLVGRTKGNTPGANGFIFLPSLRPCLDGLPPWSDTSVAVKGERKTQTE